jgi:hypothetical protein
VRRFVAIGALALLVLAVVPFTSAGSTVATKHVDGSITTSEASTDHVWIARFEARTTAAGAVDFGYLELYGIGGEVAGQIHQFTVESVTYFKTSSGAPGATFHVNECPIVPYVPCFDPTDVYTVTDGSRVGEPDTFVAGLGWTVDSGNISIYTTSDQNAQ